MHKLDLFHRHAYEFIPMKRIPNFKGSSSFQVIHYFNDTAMFQQFFKLVITPNSTTLDIGCNIGTHADMMLELGVDAVFAFEASISNIEYLRKKYESEKRFRLQPHAISNENKKVKFYDSDFANGITSLAKTPDVLKSDKIIERLVQCKRVDDIAELQHINNISCIKIDIEGADLLAIDGARQLIYRNTPYIIMEYAFNMHEFKLKGETIEATTVLQVCEELGYIPYNIYGVCVLDDEVFRSSALVDTFDLILVPESRHDHWSKYLCPKYQYKIMDLLFHRIENYDVFPGYSTFVSMPKRIYDVVNNSTRDEALSYLKRIRTNLMDIIGSIEEIDKPSLRIKNEGGHLTKDIDNDLRERGKTVLKLIYRNQLDAAYGLSCLKNVDASELKKFKKLLNC